MDAITITDYELDLLLLAASKFLRNDKDFQWLLEEAEAALTPFDLQEKRRHYLAIST
jgi:hypothetical protein